MQPDGSTRVVDQKVTVEEQLSNFASFGTVAPPAGTNGPRVITASDIAGQARQYGSAQPLEERGNQQQQQQQQPPTP